MNKVDYNKIFCQTVERLNGQRPRLLLHTCCAPCLSSCLLRILPYFDLTVYFQNDNITDKEEFDKRFNEVKRLIAIVNNNLFEVQSSTTVEVVQSPLNTSNFFDIAAGLEGEKEGGLRCPNCFKMRLFDTARFAKQNAFEYFGTTLTLSPHKHCLIINQIGAALSQDCEVKFLFADFKKSNGFLESVRLCDKYSIYRQNYCGCPFSNTAS